MKYRGVNLILDNFRSVLKGYSVDVQDVVRSAILDDIDISKYIESCKNKPYRLEQIRLCKKEGIDSSVFGVRNGECIYKIRNLNKGARDVILSKLKNEELSDELIIRLIDWLKKGYDLSNIKISLIPKHLYSVFEHGFKKGFDMSIFNNGHSYSAEYIKVCLIIKGNGKNINLFIDDTLYSIECMYILGNISKVPNDKWDVLLSATSGTGIDCNKLKLLSDCVMNGISIDKLSKGSWGVEAITQVLTGYESGIDHNKLIEEGPDADNIRKSLSDLLVAKTKKVSGRLRKQS